MQKFNLFPSLCDALFYSLMVGIGESYFPAFGLRMGMSEVQAGLLTTLPLVIGSIVPLLFVNWVEHLRSLKSWVVWSAGFQALSLLAMAVLAMAPQPSITGTFAAASLYFAAGFLAGPSWNFWMGELVSEKEAPSFFSQRLRLNQVGVFMGLFVGGMALHSPSFALVIGRWGPFAALFLLAFVFRGVSVISLTRHPGTSALEYPASRSLQATVQQILTQAAPQRFFNFLFLFYVVIYISSPFVGPFFLAELKFDYQQLMWALVALLTGKVLILPIGSRLVKAWGVRTVFLVGALGISPLPAVWVWWQSFPAAVLLQMTSGIFWGLFELGFSVIFFSHLGAGEKIPMLSLFNFFNSFAILVGSLLGAYLLGSFASAALGYEAIFSIGATLRVVTVLGFWWMVRKQEHILRENEKVENFHPPLKAQT